MAKNPSAKSTAKGTKPTAINPLPEVKAKRERKRFEPSKPGHFEAKLSAEAAAIVKKNTKTVRAAVVPASKIAATKGIDLRATTHVPKQKPSPSDVAPARSGGLVGLFARIPEGVKTKADALVTDLRDAGEGRFTLAHLLEGLISDHGDEFVNIRIAERSLTT